MELSSNEALKQAVASNMGLSVLSRYCVARECQRKELVELNVKGFPLMESWYIVYPKGRHMSPAASAFLRFLLEDGVEVIEKNCNYKYGTLVRFIHSKLYRRYYFFGDSSQNT